MYHREHGQMEGYERNFNVVQCEWEYFIWKGTSVRITLLLEPVCYVKLVGMNNLLYPLDKNNRCPKTDSLLDYPSKLKDV